MPLIPFAADPELDVLVDLGVRRVVRGDSVGRAIDERGQDRSGIRRRPQRRVHAEGRVERPRRRSRRPPTGRRVASQAQRRAPAIHSSVRARWCGVTSHVTGRPAALACRTELERARRRDMGQVQPGARHVADDIGKDREVARDRGLLGRIGPAPETEDRGHEPVVRLRAGRQPGVLGMVDDRQPERARVGHRGPQDRRRTRPGRRRR